MRIFIALLFETELHAAIAAMQRSLRSGAPGSPVRWVDPDALHLTLRFIGEQSEGRAGEWVKCLQECLAGLEAPILAANACGAFPSLRRPQVLWVGLLEHGKRLGLLQQRVERVAVDMGLKAEKRAFQPHVTLGRVRSSRARSSAQLPESLLVKLKQAGASAARPEAQRRVGLMQSHLSPSGARYEALHTWDLALRDPRSP